MRRLILCLSVLSGLLTACTTHIDIHGLEDAQRAHTVQRFVNLPIPPEVTWRQDNGPAGKHFRAYFPGIGVFTTDSTGQTVLTAVLAHRTNTHEASLSEPELLSRAHAFAVSHVPAVGSMQLYRERQTDNGADALFTATWRQRRGQAWLPALVSVSLTLDGEPAAFADNPITVPGIDTTPSIDATAATAKATAFAGRTVTVIGAPELHVIQARSHQPKLVWAITIAAARVPATPTVLEILIDARTGAAMYL